MNEFYMIMSINILSSDQTQFMQAASSDGIYGSIISYIVSYSNDTYFNLSMFPVSCMDDSCEYVVDVPSPFVLHCLTSMSLSQQLIYLDKDHLLTLIL